MRFARRNMAYSVGDKIVYPMHGAGVISAIEEQEFLGEMRRYYLLKLSYGKMGILVPVDNAESLGIRDVIDKSVIGDVLKHLQEPCEQSTINWNKRHKENLDRLRSGSIFEAAEVFKSLYLKDMKKSLSTGEKKIMNNAKQILFSEIMLAGDYDTEQVERMIKEALAV